MLTLPFTDTSNGGGQPLLNPQVGHSDGTGVLLDDDDVWRRILGS